MLPTQDLRSTWKSVYYVCMWVDVTSRLLVPLTLTFAMLQWLLPRLEFETSLCC
jgi:hypothetical protein